MAFGSIKNPSEIAIEIARERAIEKSKQASIRGADGTQKGKKERAKSPEYTFAPTKQADVRARDPKNKRQATKIG